MWIKKFDTFHSYIHQPLKLKSLSRAKFNEKNKYQPFFEYLTKEKDCFNFFKTKYNKVFFQINNLYNQYTSIKIEYDSTFNENPECFVNLDHLEAKERFLKNRRKFIESRNFSKYKREYRKRKKNKKKNSNK